MYSFAVVLESDATHFFVIFEQGYVDVAPLGVGNGIFNFCVSQMLMDEPTSALDPIATAHIEELMQELQKEVTILIVTHNMGQAMRISSKSMFMYLGELVEYGDTAAMFSNPADERTKAYLTGKMG